ncbi:MAG: hypothetical protein A2504_06885 [Bdellovibrionales bacterium RIFOXYD12_FULL_39_22]|nr:MAG: hypothetical protein A2385_09205 [Bdellovibrionales bacterium RIFOXYB1_FULL_39_21]OFZ45125.1 MAG: hypothetical protein A2485_05335 [Bdellovibrionales bacterium RIFOXYC12_FULL_39_17]OFZ45683.1 MAG: hypothetical protein A2404_03785 [Bdellovibrionales bacterium RIFOXYC1_FULL_39_130]OFZ72654.1 MAG: hypothetical protein A2451_14285 [Bdellovibrionales bacterium RIFOXYC2_FULL_39_8]OFZ77545.1 MAG: hypothetical protein A2560_09370 [Bdellovibrionales bacterium RIFOXYD1_FULL_39_84]OFZ91674.1 MAG:
MKNFVLAPPIDSFQIKYAKTGQAIPVINDVHLHSIYYPIREAEAFVTKQKTIIGEKKQVLLLGLGYGYHVNALAKYLFSSFGDDFEICVIEPFEQLVVDVTTLSLINTDKVKIFSSNNVADLFDNLELINFLVKRPAVVAHPSSFNLSSKYFKAFLEFKADKSAEGISARLCDESLKVFYHQNFTSSGQQRSYSEIINKKTKVAPLDFLFLALDKITSEGTKKLTEQV